MSCGTETAGFGGGALSLGCAVPDDGCTGRATATTGGRRDVGVADDGEELFVDASGAEGTAAVVAAVANVA